MLPLFRLEGNTSPLTFRTLKKQCSSLFLGESYLVKINVETRKQQPRYSIIIIIVITTTITIFTIIISSGSSITTTKATTAASASATTATAATTTTTITDSMLGYY